MYYIILNLKKHQTQQWPFHNPLDTANSDTNLLMVWNLAVSRVSAKWWKGILWVLNGGHPPTWISLMNLVCFILLMFIRHSPEASYFGQHQLCISPWSSLQKLHLPCCDGGMGGDVSIFPQIGHPHHRSRGWIHSGSLGSRSWRGFQEGFPGEDALGITAIQHDLRESPPKQRFNMVQSCVPQYKPPFAWSICSLYVPMFFPFFSI